MVPIFIVAPDGIVKFAATRLSNLTPKGIVITTVCAPGLITEDNWPGIEKVIKAFALFGIVGAGSGLSFLHENIATVKIKKNKMFFIIKGISKANLMNFLDNSQIGSLLIKN